MRRFRIKAVANIPQRRKTEIRADEPKETKEPQQNDTAKAKDTEEQEPPEEETTQDTHSEKVTEQAAPAASSSNDNGPRSEPGFSSFIQRKCKRTEQSRKMAEARRHFIHKFGNTTPDRQRLTMIDLIFYNPTTNPMSDKAIPKRKHEECPDKVEDVSEEVKHADEPTPNEGEEEDDPDGGVPAPQIKIGLNGEIIVDEQSLVIENAKTKKGRQELQKTAVVDGDFDTSYGVYKKSKRTRDWSKEETVTFYRVLNRIGTDFTSMQEFFPRRSRRELKTKFKKEERVNRTLIDKALTHHLPFDIEELRDLVQREEREIAEKERRMAEVHETKTKAKTLGFNTKEGGIDKILPAKRRKTATMKSETTTYKPPVKPKDLYSRLEKGINGITDDDDDDDEMNIDSDSDSSTISISTILRPTRSGRVPRPARLRTPDLEELTLISRAPPPEERRGEQDEESANVHDISNEEADSDIQLPEAAADNSIYQVFMVGPDQTRTPLTKQILAERIKDKLNSRESNQDSGGACRSESGGKTPEIMKSLSEDEKMVIEELAKSIISFSATRTEYA